MTVNPSNTTGRTGAPAMTSGGTGCTAATIFAQIRQSAPPPERRLFGIGPLTVAVPLRALGNRALGVIAAEDSLSAERLTAYLAGLQFQVHQLRIPADGAWEPPSDTIAICGPKSSPITAKAMESDPFLTFEPDDAGRWAIRDKTTGDALTSPLDHGDTNETWLTSGAWLTNTRPCS